MHDSIPRVAEAYARPIRGSEVGEKQDLRPADMHKIAQLIRHELRDRRVRMSYVQIYTLLGYRLPDGSEKHDSLVSAALHYLEFCGLVRREGMVPSAKYWLDGIRPIGDYREPCGVGTMAAENRRLRASK